MTFQELFWLKWFENKYSWLLHDTSLNCIGPFILRFFSTVLQYYTVYLHLVECRFRTLDIGQLWIRSVSTPNPYFIQGLTLSGFTGQLQKEWCFIERNIVESAGHTRPVLLSEGQYYDSGGPAGHTSNTHSSLCGQAFRNCLVQSHRFYHLIRDGMLLGMPNSSAQWLFL